MNAPLSLTPIEQALVERLADPALTKRLQAEGLPHRRVEDWRWTDLRNVLRDQKEASCAFAGHLTAPLLQPQDAIELTFANGKLVQQPVYLPENISLALNETNLPSPRATMAALAGAMSDTVLTLRLSGKTERPFHVRYLCDGAGAYQTRLRIEMAPGAEARLIECHEGAGDWFANGLTEITLQEGAKLDRVVVQAAQGEAVNVQSNIVRVDRDARYDQVSLTLGSKLTRFETCLQHAGENAKASLGGAYLLSGTAHMDHTTKVDHNFVGGVTEELFKGVIRDKGRGVFQGKFYVAKGAQQTDARMAHNALLLSDTAEVNAKPELEIYADDVQCAHGNTAGALDNDALFYMRQRGLSEDQARAMLVEAFVGDVLMLVKDAPLQEQLAEIVRRWMGEAA